MTIAAGLDVGSRMAKAVLIDENRRVLGKGLARTKPDFAGVAREALDAALARANVNEADVNYIAATGFGRYNVPFRNIQITDITCGGRGAAFLFPNTACVLDIGSQSTRAMRLWPGGKIREFRTNDKCAAGAGGFIERAARYLEVGLEDVGKLSLFADGAQTISSVCAVLAESEIINHMTEGVSVENILRGIHVSLATRAQALLMRVGLEPELAFIGGVARQAGMVKALEETLRMKIHVPADPEFATAFGAALLGLMRLAKIGRVSDPLPPSAAVPLCKGDNQTILPLTEGESRRRRQGVAHTCFRPST